MRVSLSLASNCTARLLDRMDPIQRFWLVFLYIHHCHTRPRNYSRWVCHMRHWHFHRFVSLLSSVDGAMALDISPWSAMMLSDDAQYVSHMVVAGRVVQSEVPHHMVIDGFDCATDTLVAASEGQVDAVVAMFVACGSLLVSSNAPALSNAHVADNGGRDSAQHFTQRQFLHMILQPISSIDSESHTSRHFRSHSLHAEAHFSDQRGYGHCLPF